METIVRNISDLPENERSVAEKLVGRELTSDQQLVIVVQYKPFGVDSGVSPGGNGTAPKLPECCNVYDGLSDNDIADIESVMLSRAELSRVID